MNKNEIIEYLHKENIVANIVNRYYENTENKRDFIQDMFLLILQIPEDLLIELHSNGKLVHWVSATAKNQIKSSTSHYYNTYKRFAHITEPIADEK